MKYLFAIAVLCALAAASLSPCCAAEASAGGTAPAGSGRAVTRAEVWAALETARQSGRFPAVPWPALDGFRFRAPQTLAPVAAKLAVRSVSYDALLQQWRWVLWAPDEARLLPFLVTSSGPAANAAAGILSGSFPAAPPAALPGAPLARASGAPARGPTAEQLVRAGESVHLRVLSTDLHMSLQARALEPGALHQIVRVQVAGTRQVLRGEVVARGEMESRF